MNAAIPASALAVACAFGVLAFASAPEHSPTEYALACAEAHGEAGGHMGSHPGNNCAATLMMSAQDAKEALNNTVRHREWLRVPYGTETLFVFVVYPDRANRAPVVLLNDRQHAASDWSRALADRAAEAGYLAIVPDVLTGEGPGGGATDSFRSNADISQALARLGPEEVNRRLAAIRAYALSLPLANGRSARIDLDAAGARMQAAVETRAVRPTSAVFPLDESSWRQSLSFVRAQTGDRPVFLAEGEHASHYAALARELTAQGARAANPPARSAQAPGPLDTSYAQKNPDLPASYYTAAATLVQSTRRKEWVTLDVGGVPVRTFIVYPDGAQKVGAVVVMQHGVGMDTRVQGVADQVAKAGFIAISPDIWSGTAPGGGGLETFKYVDDAIMAGRQISADEAMRRYKAARDYALKLPRSNGKTASLGFCMGGGYAFRFAGEVPELNGAVVFYGNPPSEEIMARIQSPVLGLFGENDARVVSALAPAQAAMRRLGKTYEPHVYPKATHSFVLFQDAGGNPAAIRDAWPRAVAFLRKQLTP